MKRLSRSDSSMDGAEQVALLGLGRASSRDRAMSRPRRARRQAASSGHARSRSAAPDAADRIRRCASARSMSSTRCTRSIASAPGRPAHRAGGAGRASATAPCVIVDADHADRRRVRCASAGTAAWRRATCQSRGRRGGRCSRPIWRRPDRPCPIRPRADSRPCTVIRPSSGSSSTTRTFSIRRSGYAVAHSTSSSVPCRRVCG
jgi:hypothetical protein